MTSSSLLLLCLSALATAQKCKLQFDGRVPGTFNAKTFDQNNNVFSPTNVFGASEVPCLVSESGSR